MPNLVLVVSFLLTTLGLTACQTGLQTRNLLFHTLAGSELFLHQDVIIPPGRVRAVFQDGELAYGASDYYPRCELEIMKIRDEPQTVPAGTYRIGKVRGMTHYVQQPDGNIKLAASIGIAMDDGASEWIMEAYRMTLHSDRQEDVLFLSCGGAYNYSFYAHFPSLVEMQAALGNYATIKLR